MSKPKKIENDWEVKLKKYRSEMESMLDAGATVGSVFKEYKINSRFQKDFNARYKEEYGYTLLDYKRRIRGKELEKQKELAQIKKKRQDQQPDIKECLADIVLSVVIDGKNINETLFEYRAYNQRQDINDAIQLLFDHTLLELKQDPSLVNADYVREMCRLYGEGVKITKGLKTKTQKEIKKQLRSMTDEDRRNRQLQTEIDSQNAGLMGLMKLTPGLDDQLREAYKSFADNVIGQEEARKHIRENNAVLNPCIDKSSSISEVSFDDGEDSFFGTMSLEQNKTKLAVEIVESLFGKESKVSASFWKVLEKSCIGGGRVWLDPDRVGSTVLLEEGVDKDSLIGGKSDIVMVPRWIRDIVASAKQCAAFTVEYEDVHYAMNKAELQSHLEKCRPDVLADIQGRL